MVLSSTQRTRELGIRLALGASRGNVLRLILGQGISLIAIGLAAGLLGAFAASRAVSSLLYGVGSLDAVALFGALLMLAAWGLKKGKAWGQRCLVGALVVLAIQPVLVAAVVLASDATPPPNAALWLSLVVAVSVGWTGFFLYIARKVVGTHPRG